MWLRYVGLAVFSVGIAVWILLLALYGAWFASLPPTRLNLIFLIDHDGAHCADRARSLERAPLLGTGVTLDEVCRSRCDV